MQSQVQSNYMQQRQMQYVVPNVVLPIHIDFYCNYLNRTNQIVFQKPPEKCLKLIEDCIPNEKNLYTILVTNFPYNIDYSFFIKHFHKLVKYSNLFFFYRKKLFLLYIC